MKSEQLSVNPTQSPAPVPELPLYHQQDQSPLPKQVGKPRVLLVSIGLPTGTLEVASYLKHHDLADVAVLQMHRAKLFVMVHEAEPYLNDGPVHPLIHGTFLGQGIRIPQNAKVKKTDPKSWEIRDDAKDTTYLIKKERHDFACYNMDNVRLDEAKEAFETFAKRSGTARSHFFKKDGELNPSWMVVVNAVGGGFLKRLVEFDPDHVGFRAEGVFDTHILSSYIDIVRMFSRAHVIIGGPDATKHGRSVFRLYKPDFVFAGEGEQSVAEYLAILGPRGVESKLAPDDHVRLRAIPGLIYSGGENPDIPALPEDVLDGYGMDWEILEGYRLSDGSTMTELHYSSSRGCPHHCAICSRPHGRVYRRKSPQRIMQDLEGLDRAVQDGVININQGYVYGDVDDKTLRRKVGNILGLSDEDFLLDRSRALEFFRMWEKSPLREKYRLGIQTNPTSLIRSGKVDEELMGYIDELKVRVQFGVETFNPTLLERFEKPQTMEETDVILDRMEMTGQRYAIFQLLTDYETKPQELIETLRLLAVNHIKRKGMDVWINPMTYPLFGSKVQMNLSARGLLSPELPNPWDYNRPHPELMDPLTVELLMAVDKSLEHLRFQGLPKKECQGIYLGMFNSMEKILDNKISAIAGERGIRKSIMAALRGRKGHEPPVDPEVIELEQLLKAVKDAKREARRIEMN